MWDKAAEMMYSSILASVQKSASEVRRKVGRRPLERLYGIKEKIRGRRGK